MQPDEYDMKTRPMTQGRKRQRKEPEEGDLFAEEWNAKDKEIADGQTQYDLDDLFARLSKSQFRSRFKLGIDDMEYIERNGLATIRRHAGDFVRKRLAPALIPNDGRQTPMRGHPVFTAQHATGCCCRGCMEKWHGIKKGHELTDDEQEYAVNVIMEWIKRQIEQTAH